MTTTTAAAAAANTKGNDTHLQHLQHELGGVQTTMTPAPPPSAAVENEHSCLFSRVVVVFQHPHLPLLSKTSISAHLRGWWLSASIHLPLPSKMSTYARLRGLW